MNYVANANAQGTRGAIRLRCTRKPASDDDRTRKQVRKMKM